jgi:hypothetical protein
MLTPNKSMSPWRFRGAWQGAHQSAPNLTITTFSHSFVSSSSSSSLVLTLISIAFALIQKSVRHRKVDLADALASDVISRC